MSDMGCLINLLLHHEQNIYFVFNLNNLVALLFLAGYKGVFCLMLRYGLAIIVFNNKSSIGIRNILMDFDKIVELESVFKAAVITFISRYHCMICLNIT